MLDAITVYSTENVEQNESMRKEADRQDAEHIEEYNQWCDHRVFMELEDAVGYDKAVELTS